MGRRPAMSVSTKTMTVNTTQRTIGRSSTKKEKAAVSNNRNRRMATNIVNQNRLDIFRIRDIFFRIGFLYFGFIGLVGLHVFLIIFQ